MGLVCYFVHLNEILFKMISSFLLFSMLKSQLRVCVFVCARVHAPRVFFFLSSFALEVKQHDFLLRVEFPS